MTIASDLLQQHIQTLVDDNPQWQTLIADDVVWELAYAPALGHTARLSGRQAVVGHATWFLGAVENLRFFDLKAHAFADSEGAVAEVKGEGLIKSTRRLYRQEYVLFLRGTMATNGCALPNRPLQRTWSSLTLGATPLDGSADPSSRSGTACNQQRC